MAVYVARRLLHAAAAVRPSTPGRDGSSTAGALFAIRTPIRDQLLYHRGNGCQNGIMAQSFRAMPGGCRISAAYFQQAG